MLEFVSAPRSRRAPAVLFLVFAAGALWAQQPSTAEPPAAGAPAAQSSAAKPATPESKANDEMLVRAGKLYYSTARAGLTAFDCAIQPDWHLLFTTANKGAVIAEGDPRVVLLKSVRITLHGRLKGGSTLDWNPAAANPDKPLDQDSTSMLETMHGATEQTLQGFMQFWTPFVDGSAVPPNSEGLEITKSETGYTLHAETKDAKVTEQMDNQLVLTHFDVVMDKATVKFQPTYKSTDKGLVVAGFLAHILPAGAAPEQEQEMHVGIEYQDIQGFLIPAQLNMTVVGTGTFNFALEGCSVTGASK